MATLVDSNVLLDLLTGDANRAAWSEHALRRAALAGPLLINDVIYAELVPGYRSIEALDAAVATLEVDLAAMPRAALFLAARVFAAYRRRGGVRTGVLSDCCIGAHAAASGLPLLTRDVARYRQDFPGLRLIAP